MNQTTQPVVTVLTAPGEAEPPGLDSLRARAQVRLACDEESLRATLPGTQVLMVTDFRTGALQAAWPAADRLQWVHATSAGVDAILFPELVQSDVVVTNARGIFDRAIAEYVLCTILMFAKDFPASVRLQLQHRWQHRESERIQGRQVLVVGAGSIGREIARLLRAAGMEIHGVARSPRREDPDFVAVHGQEHLTDLLGHFDYVVIAAPLTPETRGLFSTEAFRAMRPQARLINIGRGPIVDTRALVDALNKGDIAGAALDVFEEEPLPPEHPLWDMDRVLITAHMAGDVIGWRRALTDQFLENFDHWHQGRPLFNVVDKSRGYGSRQSAPAKKHS